MSDVFSAARIDRRSPIPLYFQVSQLLGQAIESGEIPNGTQFGNEIDLAQRLGLSRPTMRRAMQQLVDQGLIVRQRGVGTRVVQPKIRRPMDLTSLHDDLERAGRQPRTQVLELCTVEADSELAGRLEVEVGHAVIKTTRLRFAGTNPIAKLTNFLPQPLVGELTEEELQSEGLYALLRSRGLRLHSATQSVGARTATAAEARLLEESRGAALLTMQRVTHDDRGVVVEFGNHIYAASRYTIETDLLA